MSDTAPATNVTVNPTGVNQVDVSWPVDWKVTPGPTIGPKYHSLTLYLSGTPLNGVNPKVQVVINGANQFGSPHDVTGVFANKTEQIFTFNSTWPSTPPTVVVICTNAVGGANVRDLYLVAAAYDGQILHNISHHFTTANEKYGFTA